MPRYEPVSLGFSTADGEHPVIHYEGGELRFRFTSWQEQPVEFVAFGVIHFAWSDGLFEAELRDDTIYEVFDSPLVERLRECNAVPASTTLRHLKFGFNAQGSFDVICECIRIN